MGKLPINFTNSPIDVKHSDLINVSEDSLYRKKCPVCNDGVLLVYRDKKTFDLAEYDRCVSCGQSVRYLDIEEMRNREK